MMANDTSQSCMHTNLSRSLEELHTKVKLHKAIYPYVNSVFLLRKDIVVYGDLYGAFNLFHYLYCYVSL